MIKYIFLNRVIESIIIEVKLFYLKTLVDIIVIQINYSYQFKEVIQLQGQLISVIQVINISK